MSKREWIQRQAIQGAIFVPGMVTLFTFLSEIDLANEIVTQPITVITRWFALALIGLIIGAGIGAARQD